MSGRWLRTGPREAQVVSFFLSFLTCELDGVFLPVLPGLFVLPAAAFMVAPGCFRIALSHVTLLFEHHSRIFCSAHGRRPPCTHRSIEFLFCYPSLMCSLCGSRLNVWHVGWGSRTVKSVPRVDSNNILLLFLFVCLFVGTRPTQRGGETGVVRCWKRQRATEGQVKLATRLMLVCCCFGPGLCLVPVANRPLKYRIPRIWKWNGTSRFESIWDGVFLSCLER